MKLFLYELKNSIKNTLKLIAIVTILIVVSLGSLIVLMSKTDDADDYKIIFGVSASSEEEAYFSEIVNFANGISSLKNFCRLEILNKEEGLDKLKNNEIQMLMVAPEGFMDAAIHMQDTSVDIYCPDSMTTAQYKVLGLFSEIEGLMVNTEGAILSMYDGMSKYTFNMSQSEMEDGVMELFIMNFLSRSDYFEDIFVSPYGVFPVVIYYIMSIFILIIAFSASIQFRLYGDEEKRVEKIIYCGNRGRLVFSFLKMICVSIPLYIEMVIGLIIFNAINDEFFDRDYKVSFITFVISFIIALSISAIIQIVATFVNSNSERVTVYIILMTGIALASGMLCSSYYLPDIVRNCSVILPARHWHSSLLNSLLIYYSEFSYIPFVVSSLLLIGAAELVYYYSLRSHE